MTIMHILIYLHVYTQVYLCSPAPLHCTSKVTSGVLGPVLVSPNQETQGTAAESPVKATKLIKRLEHLCKEQSLRDLGLSKC